MPHTAIGNTKPEWAPEGATPLLKGGLDIDIETGLILPWGKTEVSPENLNHLCGQANIKLRD